MVDPTSKQMLTVLVSNVFTLIHMHRKAVKEINDVYLSKTQADTQKSELKVFYLLPSSPQLLYKLF